MIKYIVCLYIISGDSHTSVKKGHRRLKKIYLNHPQKNFFGTFWCFFTFKLLFLCLVGQYLLLYYYYTTAYNFVLKIYIIQLSNITKYYYYYNTYNYQYNNTSVQMKKKVDTIQTYKFWVLDMKWNVKKNIWKSGHIPISQVR